MDFITYRIPFKLDVTKKDIKYANSLNKKIKIKTEYSDGFEKLFVVRTIYMSVLKDLLKDIKIDQVEGYSSKQILDNIEIGKNPYYMYIRPNKSVESLCKILESGNPVSESKGKLYTAPTRLFSKLHNKMKVLSKKIDKEIK